MGNLNPGFGGSTTWSGGTISSNIDTSASPDFDFSSSTGIFDTSSGTNTLYGNVVVNAAKTFTVGTGATTLGGTLAVTGAITATGTYTSIAGNIILTGGDLTVGGDTICTGALTVTGITTINGDLTLGDAAVDTLTIKATSNFDENVVFDKEVQVTGAFSTIANATIGGVFSSNGNTVLGNATSDTIVANAVVASDLVWGVGVYDFDMTNSTGAFTFPSGAISVPGAMTFTANVDMDFVAAERLQITSSGHTAGVDAVIIDVTSTNAGVIRGLTVLQNVAATQLLDVGILVDNTNATLAITDAFSATCSGTMAAGVVNAFNASDANITNALVAGVNDLSGTHWDIAGATGAITGVTITDGAFSVNTGAITGVTTLDMTGNLTTTGTVDGVDIAGHTHKTTETQVFTGVGAIGGSVTRYIQPNDTTWNAAEALYFVATETCVIEAMYINAGTAPAGAVTTDFFVMLNGAEQTMTVQLAAAEVTGNTVTNPVTLAAGDKVSIKAVDGAGSTCANVSVSLRINNESAVPT